MSGLLFTTGFIFGVAGVLRMARTAAVHDSAAARVVRRADAEAWAARRQAKRTAEMCLEARRQRRKLRLDIETLAHKVEADEARAAQMNSPRGPLYVLDDRKGPEDLAFEVKVMHPDYHHVARGAPTDIVAGWAAGRRYLVWASTAQRAETKVAARLPAKAGYVMLSTVQMAVDPDQG
jgi:hypothetical protein